MHIKNITLKNFKFHSDLSFEIAKDNCLIYGENGTGKSSIYEALHAVFKTYFRNNGFDFQKFKKSGASDLYVEIGLGDSHQLILPNSNYALPDGVLAENKNTIYFTNHDLLEFLVGYEKNFYITIDQHLKKYFDKLQNFCETFDAINRTIDSLNYANENDRRKENSIRMEKFLTQVASTANDIIQNHFEENFELSFGYNWGMSDTEDDYKFPIPEITLQINNKENLKLNFNEAKLKLASIALFFALIKLEEESNNPLKLLVLDDFLTSLDMANRHYIMEYILNEFGGYQKIIITHNLQFYNLILKLLKNKNEINNWDVKNIFVRTINQIQEAVIYNKEINYINLAQENLDNNRLDMAGNYLRKEFERIVEELRIVNEVGAKEKLSNVVDALLNQNIDNQYRFTKTFKEQVVNMKNILIKTNFYKDTLLNTSSHNDTNTEIYEKECQGAMNVLKELNLYLKALGDK